MENTIILPINKLKPGMKVARKVENSFGAVLVPKDMILDQKLINKLCQLGIKYVKIYNESEKEVRNNINDFVFGYKESVNDIKDIFETVSINNQITFPIAQNIVNNILSVDTNRDIVNFLTSIRNVESYDYTHAVNLSLLAIMLGRRLKLSKKEIRLLGYAGLLHDIGKTKIPDEVINKKGKLNKNEFELIKKHPIHSYQLIKKCDYIPVEVANAVLMHHERTDGSGYPLGLKSNKITYYAKILAILDTYDAMTSDKIYKKYKPPFSVFKAFARNLSAFDLDLCSAFINYISKYYVGEKVKLSNGKTAEIVYTSTKNRIAQPIVRVEGEFIDIEESNLKIDDIVPVKNNVLS